MTSGEIRTVGLLAVATGRYDRQMNFKDEADALGADVAKMSETVTALTNRAKLWPAERGFNGGDAMEIALSAATTAAQVATTLRNVMYALHELRDGDSSDA